MESGARRLNVLFSLEPMLAFGIELRNDDPGESATEHLMQPGLVSAVLFVRDLGRVAAFYEQALGMTCVRRDDDHVQFDCRRFSFVVHQIPKRMLSAAAVPGPLVRRVEAALRLDFPVPSIEASRRIARTLGGDVDDSPPPWADANAGLFLGYDPEGNVFLLKQL